MDGRAVLDVRERDSMSSNTERLSAAIDALLNEYAQADDALTMVDDWVLVVATSDVEHSEEGHIAVVYPQRQWAYRSIGLLDHGMSHFSNGEIED